MSTSTPPAGRPLIPRPAGALLTKSAGGGRGGNDSKIFVTFGNGLVRQLTDVEYHCWVDVTIDYEIPVGAQYDYQYDALVAYDAALKA